MFRLKRDVIDKNPDDVFIEISVNDRIVASNLAVITMECIIRELLKLTKLPKIVLLISPMGLADACGSVHKRIAYYYNDPVIDIQDYVFKSISVGSIHGNTYQLITCILMILAIKYTRNVLKILYKMIMGYLAITIILK